MWALAVQLYGVRSRRNWGHGDFTDLAVLIDLAADLGAAGRRAQSAARSVRRPAGGAEPVLSRTAGSSSIPLYIDVEAIPEFPGLRAAGVEEEVERLRRAGLVDYAGVAARSCARSNSHTRPFAGRRSQQRHVPSIAFRKRARSLAGAICVLRVPAPQIRWSVVGMAAAMATSRGCGARWPCVETEENAIGFFEFVQWLAARAARSLSRRGLRRAACRSGSISTSQSGSAATASMPGATRTRSWPAWRLARRRTLSTPWARTGALAGFNPVGLEERRFEPFRQHAAGIHALRGGDSARSRARV